MEHGKLLHPLVATCMKSTRAKIGYAAIGEKTLSELRLSLLFRGIRSTVCRMTQFEPSTDHCGTPQNSNKLGHLDESRRTLLGSTMKAGLRPFQYGTIEAISRT